MGTLRCLFIQLGIGFPVRRRQNSFEKWLQFFKTRWYILPRKCSPSVDSSARTSALDLSVSPMSIAIRNVAPGAWETKIKHTHGLKKTQQLLSKISDDHNIPAVQHGWKYPTMNFHVLQTYTPCPSLQLQNGKHRRQIHMNMHLLDSDRKHWWSRLNREKVSAPFSLDHWILLAAEFCI